MDSHGAFATALLERDGDTPRIAVVETIKLGSSDGLDDKMRALSTSPGRSSARRSS